MSPKPGGDVSKDYPDREAWKARRATARKPKPPTYLHVSVPLILGKTPTGLGNVRAKKGRGRTYRKPRP